MIRYDLQSTQAMKDSLQLIGKMLEAAAMILVAFALFVGLSQDHSEGKELTLLMIGSCIFFAGFLLERKAGGGQA